jgi:hypothetical protein
MRRKRRTEEEWKVTLDAQEASGLTAPEYCIQSLNAQKPMALCPTITSFIYLKPLPILRQISSNYCRGMLSWVTDFRLRLRLDHHGIVAGVIDDLNIVSLLDKHLPQDDKQEITPGEAIKGMIGGRMDLTRI